MKPVIAGVILFFVWLAIMLVFGNSKNIKPDLKIPDENNSRSFGHPLWNE